jgi:CRISPR-associated protein Cas1
MAFLYLLEQGAKAGKVGGRIRVEKEDAVIAEVPVIKLEGALVYGNVSLTTPLLAHLLKESIPVYFMDSRGRPRGELRPAFSPHGELRRAQTMARLDEGKCASLCASIVWGKVNNQKVLLQRHNRRKEVKRVGQVVDFLNQCLEKLRDAVDVDEIRGMEGYSSAVYFSALRKLLPEEMGFLLRTRKPPKDAVNAMMSLGYSLLLNNILGAVESVGLDPYQGYLHAHKYGKPSLALDLMEEWRPVVVDSLVLTLVNRRAFKTSDFVTEGDSVRFEQDALRRFISYYNEAVYRRFQHPERKAPVTYLEAFHIQARRFARFILHGNPYRPLLIR